MNEERDQLLKVREAQRMLGVSKKKMAALIAEGTLSYVRDPLDKRVKLLRRADIEKLIDQRMREAA